MKTRGEKLIVLKPGPPWSKPVKSPCFTPGEWKEGTRFDPNNFTILGKPDGTCIKHVPWVPGTSEQQEQLVKFYQHLRKAALNKATQYTDQESWSAKLPNGDLIQLPHWPEAAFHIRRAKKTGVKPDEDGSSMDEPKDGAPPAKKAKKEEASCDRKQKHAAAPTVVKVSPPASAPASFIKPPAALQSKGASKPVDADPAAPEKALLMSLVFGSGKNPETAHIISALLEDMHVPCEPVKTNNPWKCTGEFEAKSVKELKEYFETTDEFEEEAVATIVRDLNSFRKVFKMLFNNVPEGWVPTEPVVPKKRALCIE
jgi:hypothetical protein